MKKLFTLAAAAFMMAFHAGAQAPYVLSTYTQPYVALTGGTSANGGTVWAFQYWQLPMPFTAKLGATTIDRVFTDGGVIYADTSGANADVFQYVFAATQDRGTGGSVSRSPLRYTTTGTAPGRIFKIENSSIGFAKEQALYGTMNDSFDAQVWIYETSNIIEMRFGDSKISHAADYFGSIAIPSDTPNFMGYGSVNYTLGLFNFAWVVAGDPASPYLDSFKNIPPVACQGIYHWPASGTVYRFSPVGALGVSPVAEKIPASLYPTLTANSFHISLGTSDATSYEVFSATGATVGLSGRLSNGVNTIDASHLTAGRYLVQLQSAGKTGVCTFIKQ